MFFFFFYIFNFAISDLPVYVRCIPQQYTHYKELFFKLLGGFYMTVHFIQFIVYIFVKEYCWGPFLWIHIQKPMRKKFNKNQGPKAHQEEERKARKVQRKNIDLPQICDKLQICSRIQICRKI